MNKALKIDRIFVVVLAAIMAVGMVSCHSSKNNQKTKQETTVVDDYRQHTSKHNHDHTPKKVADALVSEARSWIGTPYKWGGHDKAGADCSGFLMEVYKAAVDVNLPRTTKDQREKCLAVDRENISIGDIIFFSSNKSGGKIAHVGMYVGDGRMIHASSSRGVVEDNLDMNYYVTHFNSIGRVPELAKANPVPKKESETDNVVPQVKVQTQAKEPAQSKQSVVQTQVAEQTKSQATEQKLQVAEQTKMQATEPKSQVAEQTKSPVVESTQAEAAGARHSSRAKRKAQQGAKAVTTEVTDSVAQKVDATSVVKNAFGKQKQTTNDVEGSTN